MISKIGTFPAKMGWLESLLPNSIINAGFWSNKTATLLQKKMASNAIDMELKNTVFLIAPVQFSVVLNCNIIYPILKYTTKYFIFCHVHVFFYWFRGILWNSIDCAILRDFWLQNCEILEGLTKTHPSIQVVSLHIKVAVNHIQSNKQPSYYSSLLLHKGRMCIVPFPKHLNYTIT